jgi:DNA topoisomerase-1
MSKYLVIVESPTKEKTISKILGKDFIIKSSNGHIRDLPKNKIGIDINNNFKPTYVNIQKSKKIILNLKKSIFLFDKIYLATDFDREGEAIAWHLKEVLKLPNSKILRITFNEITKDAIMSSLKHPRKINENIVNSQQTRRILDRLVGYKLSPFLWKKVKIGLSAGRVQSVALMIICDREEEIKKFKPTEYWNIEVSLSKKNMIDNIFKATIFSKKNKKLNKFEIKNKKQSNKIINDIKNAIYSVKSIKKKTHKRLAYPPYTTSTMQQDASKKFGFTASKTMLIAQKLYEGISINKKNNTGLITYIRTDSLNVSKKAQTEALNFIKNSYGINYIPKKIKIYKTKTKGAQEAHEAIRPTILNKNPLEIKDFLSIDEFKLYNMIWKRFISSQMSDAIYNITVIEISVKDYFFKTSTNSLLFDGFLKVLNFNNEQKETTLPQLYVNEQLNFINFIQKQHFTEPPNRYTEASLIKIMEEYGIGRPSTYAPTIMTILNRTYVHLNDKKFLPTNLGMLVNNLLKTHFKDIININFTANIEKKLD